MGLLALAAASFFAVDTYSVVAGPRPAFDLPLALHVQSMPWGPLTYVFDLINSIAGGVQLVATAALVGIVLLLNRRDGALMVLASIASLLDNALKVVTTGRATWRADSCSASAGPLV